MIPNQFANRTTSSLATQTSFVLFLKKIFSASDFERKFLNDLSPLIKSLEKEDTKDPASVHYLLNYSTNKYLYFYEGVKALLGYEAGDFLKEGKKMDGSIIHPEDMAMMQLYWKRGVHQIYRVHKIHPEWTVLCVLYFRIKTASGEVKYCKQQNVALQFIDGQLALDFGVLSEAESNQKQKLGFEIFLISPDGTEKLESSFTNTQEENPLSIREIEIIELAAKGVPAKEKAEILHLSIHTIYQHRKNIMLKMGCSNMQAAISKAQANEWICKTKNT